MMSLSPEETGHGDGKDDATPLYSPAWVARLLGVTPATLRTWHRRYDLGPTGRTTGGHRRYSPADLERLDRMRDLSASGIGVAEAARLSQHAPTSPAAGLRMPRPRRPGPERAGGSTSGAPPDALIETLIAAGDDLDQVSAGRMVADTLHVYGVVATWTGLITPVLQRAGERFARSADGIHAEHVLSESIRAALGDVVRQDRPWSPVPPTLIAAPDGEQHVLPLHALSAGLAELNRPSVLLGASVPAIALAAAARRLGPAVIFLWSQNPATAQRVDLIDALPASNGIRPALVLGGPGWPRRLPRWATAIVDDLPTALSACVDPPSTS